MAPGTLLANLGEDTFAILTDFREAVQAPMHETEWYQFFNKQWNSYASEIGELRPESNYTLLLQRFSLEELRTDYNAIIRFTY